MNVANLSPPDGAERIAPGAAVSFDLTDIWPVTDYHHVDDFEGAEIPEWWSRPSYSADVWDLYDDGGNGVLRAQAAGTLLQLGQWRPFSSGLDVYCRLKWFTGATAGILAREAGSSSVDGVFLEIDSGGLRAGTYSSGARTAQHTSAFSPVDGTWYWLRFQVYSLSGSHTRYRGKYWTGNKGDEPGGWHIGPTYPSAGKAGGKRNERWGLRVHAGSAYFDDFEVGGMPDLESLDDIKVTINGRYSTRENGRLAVAPRYRLETFETTPILYPDVDNWHCVAVDPGAYNGDRWGDQTIEIEWWGGAPQTWGPYHHQVASFPGAPPTVDAAGDPDRLQPFRADGLPWSVVFEYLVVPQGIDVYGSAGFEWALAPFQLWRSSFDVEWFLAPPIFTMIGGEWWLARPVRTVHPTSLVVGEPVRTVHPASLVVEGNVGRHHPASLVVQGYVRTPHPVSVIAGVRFWYRGKCSAVVSAEFLHRISGSAVAYEVNDHNVLDIHVISEETYQVLVDAGITIS